MAGYHTVIGHAHLKVRNLPRSVAFYTRHFNLKVVEQVANYAFLSGGPLHHELALQALGDHAPLPQPNGVGLYHIAFEVPDQHAFVHAYQQLQADGVPVGAVDHGISWAMYFPDPDGNGLEIYVDTRHAPGGRSLWSGENSELDTDMLFNTLATLSGQPDKTEIMSRLEKLVDHRLAAGQRLDPELLAQVEALLTLPDATGKQSPD